MSKLIKLTESDNGEVILVNPAHIIRVDKDKTKDGKADLSILFLVGSAGDLNMNIKVYESFDEIINLVNLK